MNKWRWAYYLVSILALTGLLVFASYDLHLDKRWLQGLPLFRYYAMFAFPFWIAFALQYAFFPGLTFHQQKKWWGVLLAAPALFAMRSSFHLPAAWAQPEFAYKSVGYLIRASMLIFPVFLFWLILDRRQGPLYGMTKPATWAQVRYLCLLMFPLLLFAGTQTSFLAVYPKAKFLFPTPSPTLWSHWHYLAFEGSYGLDLFSMEFFFRGFLVLGLVKICKANGIIPAAVFYCMVHFGRPLGECVSSLFGGALLGMLALRTRSIYPGALLHLGLAWGMEALCAINLPSLLP